MRISVQALDQHGTAQAAADADRRDAALGLVPAQYMQQVQHDARPGSADRMADRYRTAIDVQAILGNAAEGARQADHLYL